ncbi:MAG: hypothetical protein ACK45J_08915 [Acidimicrobiaceae bacterium]|jgi:hypothetical protein|nr:hypothetical protein [Ilumatobacteraceae bacterium]
MTDEKDRFLLDRRYSAAFENLEDSVLADLASALEGDLKDGFARIIGLAEGAFDDKATLGAAVREGIAKRRMAHDAGVILAEPCTQWAIEELGDSSEDPTLDELNALLPRAIEKFGLEAVRLMVIQYSRSLKGFRELVASDERFAMGGTAAPVVVLEKDEAEQAAKREARKARKAAEAAKKAKQSGSRR